MAKRGSIRWIGLTSAQKSKATKKFKKLREAGRSEQYAKRVARAETLGKTRQQARGHKPKEHVERKEREKEQTGGLTYEQIRSIQKWINERFNPHGYREVPTEEELIEFGQERGYDAVTQYRRTWDKTRNKYLREKTNDTYENRGYGYLVHLATISGIRPQGEERWLYYH